MKTILIIVVVFVSSSLLFGDRIYVPADTSTIQGGIYLASEGDTVLVAEDTYYENINFRGKAITVASEFIMDDDTSHISKTIIDGSQPSDPDSGSVVYFISGEDTTSVLIGFTITNGTGTENQYTLDGIIYDNRGGGGIYCWRSGGRFVSNKIINNTISDDTQVTGGGLSAGDLGNDAWIILENNQIMNNTLNGIYGGAFGGGVNLDCNGKLVNNNISYNSIAATEYFAYGGGVHNYAIPSVPCTIIFEGNTITHNSVQGKGGDNWAAAGGGSGIRINRSKALILNNEISNNLLKDFGVCYKKVV